jgi:large repetitive protein
MSSRAFAAAVITAWVFLAGCADILGIEPGSSRDEGAGGSAEGGSRAAGGMGGGAGGAGPTVADRYRDAVLAQAPFAFWRFDEELDTSTAFDASGHSRHAIYQADVVRPVPGLLDGGNAFAVDQPSGETHVVLHAALNDLAVAGAPFTLETWIQTGNISAFPRPLGIFSDIVTDVGGIAWFITTNRRLAFRFEDSSGEDTIVAQNPTLADNTRYYIVATFDGDELALYIDAAAAMTSVPMRAAGTNGTEPILGSMGNPATAVDRFNGIIDDFSVYDRVLSPSEIEAHYNVGRALD